MRVSTFMVLLGLTNAYQSCTEYCKFVTSGHLNSLWRTECACITSENQFNNKLYNEDQKMASSSKDDENPIPYEIAKFSPRRISFPEQPFYLLKPVLRKKLNQAFVGRKSNKSGSDNDNKIGELERSLLNDEKRNNNDIYQAHTDFEELPLYLDVDIYRVKNHLQPKELIGLQDIQKFEKEILECVDLHILINSIVSGNKLNDVWDEKKINDYNRLSVSDLVVKIKSMCEQPIRIFLQSLNEIKASLPKKSSHIYKNKNKGLGNKHFNNLGVNQHKSLSNKQTTDTAEIFHPSQEENYLRNSLFKKYSTLKTALPETSTPSLLPLTFTELVTSSQSASPVSTLNIIGNSPKQILTTQTNAKLGTPTEINTIQDDEILTSTVSELADAISILNTNITNLDNDEKTTAAKTISNFIPVTEVIKEQDKPNTISSIPSNRVQVDLLTTIETLATIPIYPNKNYSRETMNLSLSNGGEKYIKTNDVNVYTVANFNDIYITSTEKNMLLTVSGENLNTSVNYTLSVPVTEKIGITRKPNTIGNTNAYMDNLSMESTIVTQHSNAIPINVEYSTELFKLETPHETEIVNKSLSYYLEEIHNSENTTDKPYKEIRSDTDWKTENSLFVGYSEQIDNDTVTPSKREWNKTSDSSLHIIESYTKLTSSTTPSVNEMETETEANISIKTLLDQNAANINLNAVTTQNDKLLTQNNEKGTTIELTNSLKKRPKYHQKDLVLPNILTREYINDTVVSEIIGTEILPNDDFTDNSTNYIDEKNNQFAEANQEIVGSLVFILNKHIFPARFVQNSDGQIELGIEGLTLCQKIAKNEFQDSLLVSMLCKCTTNLKSSTEEI